VPKEYKVFRVLLVIKDKKVKLVLKVLLVHKVFRVLLV